MTYSILDKMVQIFEAHVKDAISEDNRFTNRSLREASKDFTSRLHTRNTYIEFMTIAKKLEEEILRCPHPAEPKDGNSEAPTKRWSNEGS